MCAGIRRASIDGARHDFAKSNMPKIGRIQKRKLLYTPVGIVFLLLVTLYVGYSAFALYSKYAEARDKKREAQAALIEAQTREAQVKAELDRLSTDRGREEVIREKFNVVKEGEGVVIIPGEDETGTSGDASGDKKENFFQKWFGN